MTRAEVLAARAGFASAYRLGRCCSKGAAESMAALQYPMPFVPNIVQTYAGQFLHEHKNVGGVVFARSPNHSAARHREWSPSVLIADIQKNLHPEDTRAWDLSDPQDVEAVIAKIRAAHTVLTRPMVAEEEPIVNA